MLLNYQEKSRLTQANWQPALTEMGVTAEAVIEVIAREVAEKGESLISCYHFRTPAGDLGSITVCHHLGRGAISFGANTRWGHWDETLEILTLDESGEKFNFDGKPTYEGDEGSCSLGNF
jgi:hypothetical protein